MRIVEGKVLVGFCSMNSSPTSEAAARKLLLVLTVSPNGDEDSPADGYAATRAFYAAMGFVLARDLPREWENDTAVMMVRPL
jgi:hypothetical protein